jgi:hypothetical protein
MELPDFMNLYLEFEAGFDLKAREESKNGNDAE